MFKYFTVGGLDLNDEPLICGGAASGFLDTCYAYRDKEWVVAYKMNEKRYIGALCRTPTNELFISGGNAFLFDYDFPTRVIN